jgi:regulatory protein
MSFNKPIKPAKDIDAVRRSAFWHLGRRDHSEYELREKLTRKTSNQQWIDTVIKECFAYNYLNDDRFSESFIRASQNKGYGINRIRRDLQHKGISADKLSAALVDDPFDYIPSATTLLAKKYHKHLGNQSVKQKAMAFLQSKGHDFDDIFKAIELHNQDYPVDNCDYLSEAVELLSRKFKTAISERKQHDKAIRFLLSRGYRYDEIQDAIRTYNKQIDKEN